MQLLDICRRVFTRKPLVQTEEIETATQWLDAVIAKADGLILMGAGGIEQFHELKRPWNWRNLAAEMAPSKDGADLVAYIYEGYPGCRHDAEKMRMPIRYLRALELVLQRRTGNGEIPSRFDDDLPRPPEAKRQRPDRAMYGHFYTTGEPGTFLDTTVHLDRPITRGSLYLHITMRTARTIVLDVEGCMQSMPAQFGAEVGEILQRTRDQLQTFITDALQRDIGVPFYVMRRDDLLFYLNAYVGGPGRPGLGSFYPLSQGNARPEWGDAIISDISADQEKGRTRFTFLVS